MTTAGPTPDARRFSASAQRNREPILEVLRRVLPPSGLILEVASGSGEHGVCFAAALPTIVWQPSDLNAENHASIVAWREHAGLSNLLPPLLLDAAAPSWPVSAADAVVNINMIHIAPWSACEGLMRGAARVLAVGAPLVLYGPFHRDGRPTAPSNQAFDEQLRAQNPAWGVRDLEQVTAAADAAGLERDEIVPMPSNNLSLVFRRR